MKVDLEEEGGVALVRALKKLGSLRFSIWGEKARAAVDWMLVDENRAMRIRIDMVDERRLFSKN